MHISHFQQHSQQSLQLEKDAKEKHFLKMSTGMHAGINNYLHITGGLDDFSISVIIKEITEGDL